jgi:hypothetical protein
VSVDGRGLGGAVPQVGLNDPQMDAGFEQMGFVVYM